MAYEVSYVPNSVVKFKNALKKIHPALLGAGLGGLFASIGGAAEQVEGSYDTRTGKRRTIRDRIVGMARNIGSGALFGGALGLAANYGINSAATNFKFTEHPPKTLGGLLTQAARDFTPKNLPDLSRRILTPGFAPESPARLYAANLYGSDAYIAPSVADTVKAGLKKMIGLGGK